MGDSMNIITLTHPDIHRPGMLEICGRSLIQNAELPKGIPWFIVCNGTSPELKDAVHKLESDYRGVLEIIPVFKAENEGPGIGVNLCNEISEDFEYTLFLEGDWMTLSSEDSGQPRNWLPLSIQLLDEQRDVDAVYLRRFICDIDSRQTGIQTHYLGAFRFGCVDQPGPGVPMNYFVADIPAYTNNPLLRRNSAFYKKGVFPLCELRDAEGNPTEFKGNLDWGRAENNASDALRDNHGSLRMAILSWGVLSHIETTPIQGSYRIKPVKDSGCGKFYFGASTCKYGYFRVRDGFCALCKGHTPGNRMADTFKDEGVFLAELDLLKGKSPTKEELLSFLRSWNDNPTRPLEDLVL
jgi:hypothetical protein